MAPNPQRANPFLRPDDALRFAVDFASADLSRLTARRFLTWERRVHAFMNRENPFDTYYEGVIGAKKLHMLQAGTLEMLQDIVQPTTSGTGGNFVMAEIAMILRRDGVFEVLGTPLARLRFQILDVLRHVGTGKLLGCPAITPAGTLCGKPFMKVTKKRFCSTRCQARTFMRQKRAKDKAEDAAFTQEHRKAAK